MRRFFTGCFALFGLLVFLLMVGTGIALWYAARLATPMPTQLPERILLVVDLRGRLQDRALSPPGWLLGRARPNLTDTFGLLARAREDERVVGVLARLDATAHGLAVAAELRRAIAALGESGRRTVAVADTLGELGPGNEGYYLATAFDEVVLGPAGVVGLTGLVVELPYFGELLERLGIGAEIIRRERWKTAFENWVAKEPSREQRQMLEALLDDVYGRFLEALARGRGLDRARMATLVDGGPWSAREALARGLIDRIGDFREERQRLARMLDAEPVTLADYGRGLAPEADAVTVAYVSLAGTLQPGDGPLVEGVFAEAVEKALDAAAEDRRVRAVVLGLDSPGGSARAAERIAAAVARVREAGKPVVALILNSGASGAYWVAAVADAVVADADSLTGSIGVIAGKPVVGALAERLGVRWLRLQRGGHAEMFSLVEPFDPEERARLEAIVDELYRRFLTRVAEGRGLAPERVRQVAGGRVWTGAQAQKLGLVDRLGGLGAALELVRQRLDLAPETPLVLRRLPEPDLAEWLAFARRLLPLAASSPRVPASGLYAIAPLPVIR